MMATMIWKMVLNFLYIFLSYSISNPCNDMTGINLVPSMHFTLVMYHCTLTSYQAKRMMAGIRDCPSPNPGSLLQHGGTRLTD